MLNARVATVDDLDGIVDFQTRCWRESYDGIVPDAYLATAAVDARQDRWADRILTARREVRLADDGGSIVGLVSWGDGATGDLEGLEIKGLYVDASHQGTGLASELLALVPSGEPAFLWVFHDNARARRFYEREGFTDTGETGFDADTGLGVVLMMRGA